MADLFSLQRIAEQNGWAMAGLGISIDVAGLALLALTIAQVPKLVAFMEKIRTVLGGKAPASTEAAPKQAPAALTPAAFDFSPDGIKSLAKLYKTHADKLGETFPLIELYQLAVKEGLPHPHLTIKSLREAGLLLPEGEARFAWKLS